VQDVDRRPLSYVESLLRALGPLPDVARARAQILCWAFVGFALSDRALPRAQQQAVLEEMLRMALPYSTTAGAKRRLRAFSSHGEYLNPDRDGKW